MIGGRAARRSVPRWSLKRARWQRETATVLAIAGLVITIIISGALSQARAAQPTTLDRQAQQHVNALLTGIHQPAGVQPALGDPHATATITEYGDLECPACDELTSPRGWRSPDARAERYQGSGILDRIITRYVRTGEARIVYRSLNTATGGGASPQMWIPQQSAVNAAALQGKGWQLMELFSLEQGVEDTHYVTRQFIENIARQVRGLNYRRWDHAWTSDPALTAQVRRDNRAGTRLDSPEGGVATPTIVVQAPHHHALFIGDVSLTGISRAIRLAR